MNLKQNKRTEFSPEMDYSWEEAIKKIRIWFLIIALVIATSVVYADGLGTSATSIAGGAVFGYVLSPKAAIFPGISYVHITEPSADEIPDDRKDDSNGIGIQTNLSYSL